MAFANITDPLSVITPIDSGIRFPEVLEVMREKYEPDIALFCQLVMASANSGELLARIRTPDIPGPQRMSLLKMFRRCVSLVCDTETTKKITVVSTETLIDAYGASFNPDFPDGLLN